MKLREESMVGACRIETLQILLAVQDIDVLRGRIRPGAARRWPPVPGRRRGSSQPRDSWGKDEVPFDHVLTAFIGDDPLDGR